MSQWVLTSTGDTMPIQILIQSTPDERIIPVMLKQIKEFDEQKNKKYGYSISIPTDQYLSINMCPEHND